MKIASEIAQTIKNNDQTPRQFMQLLSSAFEASPEIALNRLRWVLSNQMDIKDEESAQSIAVNEQPAATPVGDSTKLLQIGFINAEIKGFTGDYRAALSSVSKLVAHLRENPLVEQVTVLQEPVNVSSLANLQGTTTDEQDTTARTPAIFKLKVILKPLNNGATQ